MTEDLLGLKRYDLRAYRSRVGARLAAFARFVAQEVEAAQLLAEAKLATSEYAAFARQL